MNKISLFDPFSYNFLEVLKVDDDITGFYLYFSALCLYYLVSTLVTIYIIISIYIFVTKFLFLVIKNSIKVIRKEKTLEQMNKVLNIRFRKNKKKTIKYSYYTFGIVLAVLIFIVDPLSFMINFEIKELGSVLTAKQLVEIKETLEYFIGLVRVILIGLFAILYVPVLASKIKNIINSNVLN